MYGLLSKLFFDIFVSVLLLRRQVFPKDMEDQQEEGDLRPVMLVAIEPEQLPS